MNRVAAWQNAHYPRRSERIADAWTHGVGLALLGIGGTVLLVLSLLIGTLGQTAAIAVYVACVVGMLAVSLAYNLSSERRRPLLRRFDHAAIFLMIAGSYTPFTTQSLAGSWSTAMSAAIWTIAGLGALAKLALPGIARRFWIPVYLALGWLGLVAIQPMIGVVPALALGLLLAGGVLYSTGVVFYLNRRLPYRRAIWHGFVIAAAVAHYAAVLTGVVLPGAGLIG